MLSLIPLAGVERSFTAPEAGLRALIERVERRGLGAVREGGGSASILCFRGKGVGEDGGVSLEAGEIHEWFGGDEGAAAPEARRRWTPSMGALVELAVRAMESKAQKKAVWIGRRCWPYPVAMQRRLRRSVGLLSDALFVDPPDDASRVWAIDLALRCPVVAVVVADGSRLTMAATRRLQLAAMSTGAIALLARPVWESKSLSAARTRWRVTPMRSETDEPMWEIELLRRKGVRPVMETAQRFAARWEHETGNVCVVSDVYDRPAAQAPATSGIEARIA